MKNNELYYETHYEGNKFILSVFVESDPEDEPSEDDFIIEGKRGFFCETYFSKSKPIPIAFPDPDDDFSVPFNGGYFACLPYNKEALKKVLNENEETIKKLLSDLK